MEKHGVESDRGTINREREEYNRIVVDLQTYRKEKKALEQEIARKQEQKQKVEHFIRLQNEFICKKLPNY